MQYVPPINGDVGDPDRSYVNANLSIGLQGSIPPAESVEHPMREIVNVITAGGLIPSDSSLTQLRDAILNIISANTAPDANETVKGKIEIATPEEALAGTDSIRAVTSAGLASSKSLGASGYYKLPGGLIIQWGSFTFTSAGTNNIFPLAFPNSCKGLVTGLIGGASVNTYAACSSPSTTGFTGYLSGSTGSATVFCIAIGN